ncbi:MAG: hypothetical protein FWG98_04570 [Candidatus Cloacimonetes bacterium]|nr:hypothetical protein [Candidatus Cloacimonadota bacterium]
MKRLLLVVALVIMSIGLFAQITPYGSARMGFWYENRDKYLNDGENSRLSMNYFLQSNSRLGVNYRHENFDGRIEMGIGSGFSLRLLYGRQDFGDWSLLVGQDVIQGTDFLPNQVGGPPGDLALMEYGVAWGGRVPQVRLEMDNGLFAALLIPNTANDPAGNLKDEDIDDAIDYLIPRINLGYKIDLGDIKITPAAVLQYYNYNKDLAAIKVTRDAWREEEDDNGNMEWKKYDLTKSYFTDQSVLSFIGAVTAEMNIEPITLNAQFNIGSNIGNMGYAVNQRAGWKQEVREIHDEEERLVDFVIEDHELLDVLTFGGILTATYALNPAINITAGGGYTQSSRDDWDNDDSRMSVYLQAGLRYGRLRVTPEVGLIDEMKDANDDKRGSMMYFGTQLRFDF